ncbi:MAG: hypothetical protein KKC84_03265, partial [Candidatus Omnitrophica bacterium]|nr:hypothetical protein [Candidatus Omnitrophota bacterium]
MIRLNNNYFCALDIGSSKIAAAVAHGKKGRLESIFMESVPSRGIRGGVIVDAIELVSAITALMKSLKSKSGIPIRVISTNISGQDITTKRSRAIIPLTERGNKVITRSDIHRVNEQARILGSSLDEEIIHMYPVNYTIDAKAHVQNPLGLYSHRLEVDLLLICGKLSSIQTLNRVIHQSGYEVQDLFFSGIATKAVIGDNRYAKKAGFTEYEEEIRQISVLCDVGSDITEVVFFEGSRIREIEIVSMGGNDVTRALAEAFKVPFELAEEIKRSHGMIVDSAHIPEDK